MPIVKLTSNNFGDVALSTKKTVLIDFYAEWCGPCKMMSPIIDRIANEKNDVIVAKVDVDEEPEIANAYSIQSIPTLVVLRDGKLLNKTIGYIPYESVMELLK